MRNIEKTLDLLWSARILDIYRFCVYCGKPSTDAMHILSRRHKATRWLLRNGRGGCRDCHRAETIEGLRKLLGDEYDRLRKLALTNFKPTQAWMDETLKTLIDDHS